MRIDPHFWSKAKSFAIITSGGFGVFTGFSIYKENEKFYDTWLMPFVHKLDPETSHKIALNASKYKLLPKSLYKDPNTLKTEVIGLKFGNPIGIAAGFDKQGEAVESLHEIGFGFVEIGSVTPLPQPGNDKPRVFRLDNENAIINRYGFNSDGHETVYQRLKSIREKGTFTGVIGVNLGKNKNSTDAVQDYVKGIEKFGDVADYLVINVSSPNTPGLRHWQRREQLEELLSTLLQARNSLKVTKKPPLLLKLAPDLSDEERKDIAEVIQLKKCKVDGLVISNTTVHRPGITNPKGDEEGGLSGQPLNSLSTKLISDMYHYTNGKIPIIGVGGVFTGQDAFEKILAGASLIQLYTAFAFHGPPRVARIKRELDELLRNNGYKFISDAIGQGKSFNVEDKSSLNCCLDLIMEGFIGLHVGAGSHSHKLESQYKKLCKRASKEGALLLKEGKSAMEVAETVTIILENSSLTNAGFGSTLTWDGKVECDASIMDGLSLKWGGVGAVPGVKNPISLARALCEKQGGVLSLGRIPPCLLVGNGAKKWAKEAGVATVPSRKLISERSFKMYQKYKRKVTLLEEVTGKVLTPLDTVGVVCLDKSGNVAASCSSGGIALKHSGRVGQAGIYGSGVWAENGKETSIAVCSSGCGEYLVRTMLAKEIFDELKTATCSISALHRSLKIKFLDSPFLSGITEKLGGVAALKVNKNGFGEFLWGHTTSTMCLGFMSTLDSSPKSRLSCLSPGQTPGQNIVIEGTSFRAKSNFNEDLDDNISMDSPI